MIIMTERKFQEKMEKEREEMWRMEREVKMNERLFALERRVDKLEGKEPEELTPVCSPL